MEQPNEKIELKKEDYESYRGQILQGIRIRKMSEENDEVILNWLNKKIKEFEEKDKKNAEKYVG